MPLVHAFYNERSAGLIFRKPIQAVVLAAILCGVAAAGFILADKSAVRQLFEPAADRPTNAGLILR